MKQSTFASLAWKEKDKVTRRERFLGGMDAVDETTILRFRHLLEKHYRTQAIFAQVRTLLEQKRLLLKSGTIVDATIIEAPPSTELPRSGLLIGCACFLMVSGAFAQNRGAAQSPRQRAEKLVFQMTLDEKIATVTGVFGAALPPHENTAPKAALGGDGYAPGTKRLGFPDLNLIGAGLGVTDLGKRSNGASTALPSTLAVASSFDAGLAHDYGAVIGEETRREGFNVSLGGGVDLTRDPRGGRAFEYHGEDPLLAGRMVGAELRATEEAGVVATIKHYAFNDIENDRHGLDVKIGRRAMHESELLAFEIGLSESGAGAVMCSYNLVNGAYACQNHYLLDEVLKQEWGFDGWVMSDWGAVRKPKAAVLAGLDQDFFQKDFGPALKAAIRSGEVPRARLDDMVTRIVSQLARVGALDRHDSIQPINVARGAQVSLRTAEEGSVLLKNDRILPLDPGAKQTIAVIGFHADKGVMAGGGSSQVDPIGGNAIPPAQTPTSVAEIMATTMWDPSPPLAAIRNLAKGSTVTWNDGTDPKAAAAAAAGADIAIVFAGRHRHEGADLPGLSLGDGQAAMIAAVAKANPNTVVVLETGGAQTMPWIGDVKAVLESWYPGERGGEAIANLLFGVVNPSGKLPLTFPRSEADMPRPTLPGPSLGTATNAASMENPIRSTVTYDEGALVGYKWYDAKGKTPLFPFGYGLSYTRFGYGGLSAAFGDHPQVTFDLTNTGDRDGTEIAEVYVAVPGSGVPRRLAGWVRATLAKGQSGRFTASLDPRLLANWDVADKRWVMPAGTYVVSVGASSRDLRLTTRVTEDKDRVLPASSDRAAR